jgi:hypothetical protein
MIPNEPNRFQGIYSDLNNKWISDNRFLLCLARIVIENPGYEFIVDSESNILGIDDFDEITFDELDSDFGISNALPNPP